MVVSTETLTKRSFTDLSAFAIKFHRTALLREYGNTPFAVDTLESFKQDDYYFQTRSPLYLPYRQIGGVARSFSVVASNSQKRRSVPEKVLGCRFCRLLLYLNHRYR
jgi:hypothetical protein